jgi:superfamily II DNA helicase RecQ
MAWLTFRACIFSGIVCQECGVALDNVNMRASKLKEHCAKKHKKMDVNEKNQFDRVTVEMKNLASCLLSFNTVNDKKKMCELYLDEKIGVWCNHETCRRGYKNERQHFGETRVQHRNNNHFTPQVLKFPILPESTTLFFSEDEWNFPTYEDKFSKYFNKFYAPAAKMRAKNPDEFPHAADILNDSDVQKVLALAKSDPRDLSSKPRICVVLVPTVALSEGMLNDLNDLHLVRAVRWQNSNHQHIVGQIEGQILAQNLEVLILTTAYAAQRGNAEILSQLFQQDDAYQLVVDEAHTIVTDTYRHDIGKTYLISRHGKPLYGLTGTLQKALTDEVRHCMAFSAGRVSQYSHDVANNVTAPTSLSEYDRRELTDKWLQSHGIIRPRFTVPHNVHHHVVDIGNITNIDATFYQQVAEFVWWGVEFEIWKCVQIIVPRREDANGLHKAMEKKFPDTTILKMVSGEVTRQDLESWQDPDTTCHLVSTTCGTLGLNNTRCNAVINCMTYFGVQSLVQAASRSGREGQTSISVFLHAKNRWNMSLRDDEEFRTMAYKAHGINVHRPGVYSCLSYSSMKEFLNTTGCRMVSLHKAMDGESPESGITECRCDNCSQGNQMGQLWSNAVGLVRDSQPIDEVEGDDVYWDEMDSDVHMETQDQVRNNRMSLESTMDDWISIIGRNNTNCVWHHLHDVHIGIRDNGQVLQSRDCRHPLMRLLGHENKHDWFCYECGDAGSKANPQCDRLGSCQYKSMERNHITANCNKCWYVRCPRQDSRRDECPQVRLRALAIWALRSEEGYHCVQAKYNGSVPLPSRIPFHHEIDDLGITQQQNIRNWKHAQVWLLSSEQINLNFWKAVKEAVSEFLE